MASENKKRKGKNSFLGDWGLKSGKVKLKRLLFYTSLDRKKNKVKDEDYY